MNAYDDKTSDEFVKIYDSHLYSNFTKWLVASHGTPKNTEDRDSFGNVYPLFPAAIALTVLVVLVAIFGLVYIYLRCRGLCLSQGVVEPRWHCALRIILAIVLIIILAAIIYGLYISIDAFVGEGEMSKLMRKQKVEGKSSEMLKINDVELIDFVAHKDNILTDVFTQNIDKIHEEINGTLMETGRLVTRLDELGNYLEDIEIDIEYLSVGVVEWSDFTRFFYRNMTNFLQQTKHGTKIIDDLHFNTFYVTSLQAVTLLNIQKVLQGIRFILNGLKLSYALTRDLPEQLDGQMAPLLSEVLKDMGNVLVETGKKSAKIEEESKNEEPYYKQLNSRYSSFPIATAPFCYILIIALCIIVILAMVHEYVLCDRCPLVRSILYQIAAMLAILIFVVVGILCIFILVAGLTGYIHTPMDESGAKEKYTYGDLPEMQQLRMENVDEFSPVIDHIISNITENSLWIKHKLRDVVSLIGTSSICTDLKRRVSIQYLQQIYDIILPFALLHGAPEWRDVALCNLNRLKITRIQSYKSSEMALCVNRLTDSCRRLVNIFRTSDIEKSVREALSEIIRVADFYEKNLDRYLAAAKGGFNKLVAKKLYGHSEDLNSAAKPRPINGEKLSSDEERTVLYSVLILGIGSGLFLILMCLIPLIPILIILAKVYEFRPGKSAIPGTSLYRRNTKEEIKKDSGIDAEKSLSSFPKCHGKCRTSRAGSVESGKFNYNPVEDKLASDQLTKEDERSYRYPSLSGEPISDRDIYRGDHRNTTEEQRRSTSVSKEGKRKSQRDTIESKRLTNRSTIEDRRKSYRETMEAKRKSLRETVAGKRLSQRDTITGKRLSQRDTLSGKRFSQRNTITGKRLSQRDTIAGKRLSQRDTNDQKRKSLRETIGGKRASRRKTLDEAPLSRRGTLDGKRSTHRNPIAEKPKSHRETIEDTPDSPRHTAEPTSFPDRSTIETTPFSHREEMYLSRATDEERIISDSDINIETGGLSPQRSTHRGTIEESCTCILDDIVKSGDSSANKFNEYDVLAVQRLLEEVKFLKQNGQSKVPTCESYYRNLFAKGEELAASHTYKSVQNEMNKLDKRRDSKYKAKPINNNIVYDNVIPHICDNSNCPANVAAQMGHNCCGACCMYNSYHPQANINCCEQDLNSVACDCSCSEDKDIESEKDSSVHVKRASTSEEEHIETNKLSKVFEQRRSSTQDNSSESEERMNRRKQFRRIVEEHWRNRIKKEHSSNEGKDHVKDREYEKNNRGTSRGGRDQSRSTEKRRSEKEARDDYGPRQHHSRSIERLFSKSDDEEKIRKHRRSTEESRRYTRNSSGNSTSEKDQEHYGESNNRARRRSADEPPKEGIKSRSVSRSAKENRLKRKVEESNYKKDRRSRSSSKPQRRTEKDSRSSSGELTEKEDQNRARDQRRRERKPASTSDELRGNRKYCDSCGCDKEYTEEVAGSKARKRGRTEKRSSTKGKTLERHKNESDRSRGKERRNERAEHTSGSARRRSEKDYKTKTKKWRGTETDDLDSGMARSSNEKTNRSNSNEHKRKEVSEPRYTGKSSPCCRLYKSYSITGFNLGTCQCLCSHEQNNYMNNQILGRQVKRNGLQELQNHVEKWPDERRRSWNGREMESNRSGARYQDPDHAPVGSETSSSIREQKESSSSDRPKQSHARKNSRFMRMHGTDEWESTRHYREQVRSERQSRAENIRRVSTDCDDDNPTTSQHKRCPCGLSIELNATPCENICGNVCENVWEDIFGCVVPNDNDCIVYPNCQ